MQADMHGKLHAALRRWFLPLIRRQQQQPNIYYGNHRSRRTSLFSFGSISLGVGIWKVWQKTSSALQNLVRHNQFILQLILKWFQWKEFWIWRNIDSQLFQRKQENFEGHTMATGPEEEKELWSTRSSSLSSLSNDESIYRSLIIPITLITFKRATKMEWVSILVTQ